MTRIRIAATSVLIASLGLVPGARAARNVACVQLETSSPQATNASGRYSVAATLDLTLTVLFRPDTTGDHVLTLDVITPDGHLYRSLETPITTDPNAPQTRRLPGYVRPVKQHLLKAVTRGNSPFLAVDVPFPVGGTDIVSAGLYGKWRVDARLDGRRNPCANAAFFTLTK